MELQTKFAPTVELYLGNPKITKIKVNVRAHISFGQKSKRTFRHIWSN